MHYRPKHFGDRRTDPEAAKREAWRRHGTFVVRSSDKQLDLTERDLVKHLGEKLYGGPKPNQGYRYGR